MRRWRRSVAGLAVVSLTLSLAGEARAADPVQNPAQDAAEEGTEEGGDDGEAVDVPRVQVEGQKKQPKANDTVGTYDQPRWTLGRPFSASRVYVSPAGHAEFNTFFTPEVSLADPSEGSLETEYEFEMGIGHRMQIDLYVVGLQDGWDAPYRIAEEKFELRYAFADWGEIWGNPTLYLEWAHAAVATEDGLGGAFSFEPKILLGGNITDKIFGATNLVYEKPFGGNADPSAHEFALTGGLSYLVHDPKVFLGADLEVEGEVEEGGFVEWGLVAGPTLQWYPLEPVHIGLTTYVGPAFELEEEQVGLDRTVTEWQSEAIFRSLVKVGYEF